LAVGNRVEANLRLTPNVATIAIMPLHRSIPDARFSRALLEKEKEFLTS
jgi:hypothetical protein